MEHVSFLMQLRENIKVKRRGKLSIGVLFHQDNAPAHTSVIAMAAINERVFELVQHPPFSPETPLNQTSSYIPKVEKSHFWYPFSVR